MPFAGYTNFDDCVSRNRDKRDPDAYCGSIKHKVEDKALDSVRAGIGEIKKLFGKKPTVPKGPIQNPQPQGIPAKVYQGKGFKGVAPAQKPGGAPHAGWQRGGGRFGKQIDPRRPVRERPIITRTPEMERSWASMSPEEHKVHHDAAMRAWSSKPEPVKKDGGVEEATPELADVTMIGRTLQSVSEILSEHAKEHHELDKKKGRKQSFAQRGRPAQPGRKPHGQVKPRQQRGTAHGQRVAKQRFAPSPADPKRGELPKPPKTTPEHGLGAGWQHSHGSASGSWQHGHAFGAHPNRKGGTVAKHETEENPEHSHDPTGGGGGYKREPAYGIRWTEYNRQDRRVTREKIFTSSKARDRFISSLEDKPNFSSIESYLDEDGDVQKQLPTPERMSSAHRARGDAFRPESVEPYSQSHGGRPHFHAQGTGRPYDWRHDRGYEYTSNVSETHAPGDKHHPSPPAARTDKPRRLSGGFSMHGPVRKQHPDEYPEEWGPKHLYQKIGEKTAEIKKTLNKHELGMTHSHEPAQTRSAPTAQHGGPKPHEHHSGLPHAYTHAHSRTRRPHADPYSPTTSKALSSPRRTLTDEEIYRPIHGRGAYEQTGAAPKKPKKGSVHPALSRTHEAPPYGTQAHETWQKTQKALGEIQKAVGDCPAGWHKHAPYDYCHPTKRAHRGQTRMKPAGGLDDAHGVIDQAIVQAHAIGSKVAVEAFGQIKDALSEFDNPAKAFKVLSIWQNFYTNTAKSVSDPRQRMAMSMVAVVLRNAAAKVKPKPGQNLAETYRKWDTKTLVESMNEIAEHIESYSKEGEHVESFWPERLKAIKAEIHRRGQEEQRNEPARQHEHNSKAWERSQNPQLARLRAEYAKLHEAIQRGGAPREAYDQLRAINAKLKAFGAGYRDKPGL